MNNSTLKKTVALAFVSLMLVGIASAQTDTTKSMKTMTSDSTTTPKLFGGTGQYNHWSVGVNAGATTFGMLTGGNYKWYKNPPAFAFGLNVSDQITHFFSASFDFQFGDVVGHNLPNANYQLSKTVNLTTEIGTPGVAGLSSTTRYHSYILGGAVNVGSVSFLKRKNNVNFFVKGGIGMIYYNPTTDFYNVTNGQVQFDHQYTWRNVLPAGPNGEYTTSFNPYNIGTDGSKRYADEYVMSPGAGAKIKLTDALDLELGYSEYFLDGFNFTGIATGFPSVKDKYSYGYGGLTYTFGSKSKPSLEWVNPIALMYDELYDAALRQEVEALKGRVANVEKAVADLKKDSDGDGVADQFDKCPNTPAGTVVDGSGCPIIFPKLDTAAVCKFCNPAKPVVCTYCNIQFEFDSSVLKTSSYPILDATSADLRTKSNTITLAGYASSEGTAAHNLRLSRDRANSVKTYLVNSGVAAKRLKIKAYGETHPIADNSTEEGRILNRRVEFHDYK